MTVQECKEFIDTYFKKKNYEFNNIDDIQYVKGEVRIEIYISNIYLESRFIVYHEWEYIQTFSISFENSQTDEIEYLVSNKMKKIEEYLFEKFYNAESFV